MYCISRKPGIRKTYTNDLDKVFAEFIRPYSGGTAMRNSQRAHSQNPAVNIAEYGNRFIIEIGLPGYVREDVEITIDKDVLHVKSNKEITPNRKYRLREFGYGGFDKKFSLPETVETDKIQAEFVRGILTITLDKKEEAIPAPPKEIKIQ